MNRTPEFANIVDGEIAANDLVAIARIVRACAELEDMTMLHICKLAGITEARGMIVMGRTSISTMKKIALQLAKINGKEALEAHKSVYNKQFDKLTKHRNVLAHGVLIGVDEEGRYVFMSADVDDTTEIGTYAKLSHSYSSETLQDMADIAEGTLPKVEEQLGLQSMRERPYRKSLEILCKDRHPLK